MVLGLTFFGTRKSFDWQCKTWIRHLNDFLKTEPAGSVTIEEAEEFGKYAEEYGTMCYSQHKIVASNGKKLLSLLQGKNLKTSHSLVSLQHLVSFQTNVTL